MKYSFKFSNLLGTIYHKGNLVFTSDGNSLISPVGNRLTVYDLKQNKSKTLPVESKYNYNAIALSPNGNLIIAVNEHGEAQLISTISCAVLHRHKFKSGVQHVTFSPDGAHFAVAQSNIVFVFRSPGEETDEYRPFLLERCYLGGYDDITWLDWSSDSRFLAVGCRDNTTKVIAIRFMQKFRTYILSGHTDAIVGCFFEAESLHLNTISRNGQLCLWECSLGLSDIVDGNTIAKESDMPESKKKKKGLKTDDEDSEDDVESDLEKKEDEEENSLKPTDDNEITDENAKKSHPFFYKKLGRHYLADAPRKENRHAVLTAVHYNNKTKVMVVGFSTGCFYLYEIPDVNMIHSLSITDYAISSAVFNCTGDWVALASKELGQLLVWEWQSEHYIMKQQGHTSEMNCISYSPDGQYIATGGMDSKVKLWNVENGFCFVTFSEHTSGVTGVQFSKNKKFLVSSSLDGTVRAFDIIRYRNFRVLTSTSQVQFSCVAIDNSGELVAAGGQDVFEVYLWSMKLGKLLEVITGHEGPVSSVVFSPLSTSSMLVSTSWDKRIKVWNCLESNSEHESIDLLSDAMCAAFNPNGEEVAVSTINGHITVFDIKTATQTGCIEGRNDLGSGRLETDVITSKKNLEGQYFTSLEYSADGECIVAGGKSQNICIYHVKEMILLKKFEITQNHSFDGLNEYISRRHLSEFGNMALIEKREELEGGNVTIRLPGVQKGDMAARKYKPQIRTYAVRFSPTGHAFAVACTEGLCIYSLDRGLVFDPFNLSIEITPKAIRECLEKREFSKALIMSIKLNEINYINLCLEQIPYQDIELICTDLPNEIAQRLLQPLAKITQTSPHIEFYLKWCRSLLTSHGNRDGVFQHHSLLAMQETLSRKYESLNRICDFNKYTLRVIIEAAEKKAKQPSGESRGVDASDDEMVLVQTETGRDGSESAFSTDTSDED